MEALCSKCHRGKGEDGKRLCEPCREGMRARHSQRTASRRASGLCHCGREREDAAKKLCVACRTYANDRQKKYYASPEGKAICKAVQARVYVKHYARRLEAGKNAAYQKKYGIDSVEVDAMIAEQNGLCHICYAPVSREARTAHVDHDHSDGEVRSILCPRCNSGLSFVENTDWLGRAKQYLAWHQFKKRRVA